MVARNSGERIGTLVYTIDIENKRRDFKSHKVITECQDEKKCRMEGWKN